MLHCCAAQQRKLGGWLFPLHISETIKPFSKIKKAAHGLKGQNSLRRTAAIQERVTAVLRSIPIEDFADSFQKLYERCQPCVVKDGDYFEGQ
jgi:hypothetical protein